jgi:hypothetical protein
MEPTLAINTINVLDRENSFKPIFNSGSSVFANTIAGKTRK